MRLLLVGLVPVPGAPVVFGTLGVVAGMMTIAKGDRWWGMLAVSGSAVAGVAGYWWALWLGG